MSYISNFFKERVLKNLFAVIATQFFFSIANSQMRQVYLDSDPDNEIRKISFYSASEGYVAFNDWIGYTNDSGRTFTKKYITQLNVDFGLNSVNLTFGFLIEGVKAFNKDTIITYGHYGLVPAILRSTNGGNNFTLVFHNNFFPTAFKSGITDMIFPENKNIGFAVDADRVLKTVDGGLSWSRVILDPNRYFTNLQGINDNIVFAFSTHNNKYKVIRTLDGGTSWATFRIPDGVLLDAYFSTRDVGWASVDIDDKFYIYKTTTAGLAWTAANDPGAVPFESHKMKFVNDTVGYALGFVHYDLSGSSQNTVFKTSDGGRIWSPLPRDNDFSYLGYSHNDLYILNNNQFWAGGGHGLLEITNNAGGTPLPKAYFKFDTTGVVPVGNVSLVNSSKTGFQYKWYLNDVLISNSYHASYKHDFRRDWDTVKLVVSNGSNSDSVTRRQYYEVPPIPTVLSFAPVTGSTGTMVTIEGINFSGVTNVSFGGVSATSFSIVSPTMIRAIVGNGASGDIGLTNIYGTFGYPAFIYFSPPSSPPPVISSFGPLSGPIGTAVTINGSNFNSDPTNNIVFFGATKATVLSATTSKIVCTVPAGASYVPISVLNKTNGLTGSANKPFNVVFADSSNFTVNSFVVPVMSFSYLSDYPKTPDGADLDGDGKPDLIYWARPIYIHRNTSTGGNFSFAPKMQLQGGSGKFSLKDLDGDGKLDIVSASYQDFIYLHLNTSTPGNISFSPAMTVPVGGATWEIAIDDLDNDGKPDLAVAGGRLSILRNTSSPGNLSFAESSFYQPSVVSVAIGDLDGDNKKDVVSFSGDTFSYFKNLSSAGNIVLSPKTDISVIHQGGFTGRNTYIADFDGDNRQEVVLLNDYGCHLFQNTSTNGHISFAPEVPYQIYGYAQGLTIANLSGDSKPDLLMGNAYSPNMYLFRNTSASGNINTDPVVTVPAGNSPSFTNAADFNLDGRPDIVFSAGYNVSILKNSLGDKIPVSLCSGGNGTIDSDFGGASYQWQQKIGSAPFVSLNDNSVFSGTKTAQLKLTTIPLNMRETLFRCVVDSNFFSSTFILKITHVSPPEVSIVASDTSICYGTSVTFTAPTVGGGVAPDYIWRVNGIHVATTNVATYKRYNLNHNDQVSVIVVKGHDCAVIRDTSNIITMTVTGGQPAVSISATASYICSGTSVTFTATPVHGGLPTYQWRLNGRNAGTNSNTFTTSSLGNRDQVSVIMTADGACIPPDPIESNTISITVMSSSPPAVTISTPNVSVCRGSMVTFLATPTNGGSLPSYQWQVNGVNAGTNSNTFSTSSLNNNDDVKVILTSNASCISANVATSNSINIIVNYAVAPFVSIIASSSNICAGSLATFTATPVNGGSPPSYQWQVNGINAGINSSTFSTSSLKNNDEIKVIMTSTEQCIINSTATSNLIIMSVNDVVASSVGIAASSSTVCAGSNVTFTATPVNGGNSPVYQWQINGVNAGANSSTFSSSSLKNLDEVKVIMTSNNQCTAITVSNSVSMTVNNVVSPSVSIVATSATMCAGNAVTFTATPVNGGNSPSYQWQINDANVGTNSNTFTTSSVNNNDEIKVILTSSLVCVTAQTANSNSIKMAVNSNSVVPSVSIVASSSTICAGSNASFTATPVNGGSSPIYQWKRNGINTGTNSNIYSSNTLANGDIVSVVLTSNAPCVSPVSAVSNEIAMVVSAVTTPGISISGSTTVVEGQTTSISATSTYPGTAPTFEWQDSTNTHGWQIISGASADAINYQPAHSGDKLRCILSSNDACVSQPNAISNVLEFNVTEVTAIDPVPGSHYNIRLYPNPVTSILIIDTLKVSDRWYSLQITTIDGKKLLSKDIANQTIVAIDVSRLPAGLYFAILTRRSGETAYLKFVKQN